MAIRHFSGLNRFLSNFYPCQIVDTIDGRIFPTVEHAFQAAKTDDPTWREAIRKAATPARAKALGRQAPLRADWDDKKRLVMEGLLRQKFSSPALARALLLTEGDLVEGNDWHDTFWGVCGGVGENHLGRLLMQIREDLR